MKRIYSLFLLAVLSIAFSTAYAQRSIFIWTNDGNLTIESTEEVDSVTFSVGNWLFQFNTSEATSISTKTFQASVNVAYVNNVYSLWRKPDVGVCISSNNVDPTCADDHKFLGTSDGTYDFTFYELDPGTTYYYRAYARLGDDIYYGDVKSVKTYGEKPTTSADIIINGHKFVDLGLPSGLLWAKSNVGAASSSDYGDYYAWGEVNPKPDYDWENYMWEAHDDVNHPFTKYCSIDDKFVLDQDDDVASVRWGLPCRMPDDSDFKELEHYCDYSNETFQGTWGRLFTGPNGNTLFLPHAVGYYWSRSRSSNNHPENAWAYYFQNISLYPSNYYYRCYGFPVRPVAQKQLK